jgi:sigma54-dependent transcription regulator
LYREIFYDVKVIPLQDAQTDKLSCSVEKSASNLGADREIDFPHLNLSHAKEEPVSDLSRALEVDEQKFVPQESMDFEAVYMKNENEAVSFNLSSNKSSFVLEENSTFVVAQVCSVILRSNITPLL